MTTTTPTKPLIKKNTLLLAPMVRVGNIPFRALCLKYGYDYVWTEEIIDRKLTSTKRVYNEQLGTWDFGVGGAVILRIDPILEKGRIVLQIGTCTPEFALEAAQKVQDLVGAVDINMGCPKTFSVHGGMGACLLSDVEKASSIIRHLATHLTIPVMAKIRILDTIGDTIAFIQALQAAGCSAVTVHLRKRSVESTVPAATWEVMKEIVEGVRPFPVIANGDLYSPTAITDMLDNSGCHAVMVARPALLNASMFMPCRGEGLGGCLPQLQVIRDYLTECRKYQSQHKNVKYTIMEMMIERRHTTGITRQLAEEGKVEFGRMDPHFLQVSEAKSLEEICRIFGMNAAVAPAVATAVATSSTSTKTITTTATSSSSSSSSGSGNSIHSSSSSLLHKRKTEDSNGKEDEAALLEDGGRNVVRRRVDTETVTRIDWIDTTVAPSAAGAGVTEAGAAIETTWMTEPSITTMNHTEIETEISDGHKYSDSYFAGAQGLVRSTFKIQPPLLKEPTSSPSPSPPLESSPQLQQQQQQALPSQ